MARRPRIPAELTKRPFSLQEARAAGVSRRALAGRSWRRIGTELYCWRGLEYNNWHLLVAWRSQLPPGAVFAGLTAAWLHRLDVDPCHPIEVIASGVKSRPGLCVRSCSIRDITIVRGLRATTPARTFGDLRRRLPDLELLILADQALRLNLGRFHELAEPAESPMETRLRWSLIRADLPRPKVQANIHDANGRFIGRAD
ncbi:MAG TPA: hypothetical protein VKE27_08370, partial [Candidatus Dormibacteraeota bacterium]|nr:hypothetical protein [Candidatus Dormibacteraeota bacterium]